MTPWYSALNFHKFPVYFERWSTSHLSVIARAGHPDSDLWWPSCKRGGFHKGREVLHLLFACRGVCIRSTLASLFNNIWKWGRTYWVYRILKVKIHDSALGPPIRLRSQYETLTHLYPSRLCPDIGTSLDVACGHSCWNWGICGLQYSSQVYVYLILCNKRPHFGSYICEFRLVPPCMVTYAIVLTLSERIKAGFAWQVFRKMFLNWVNSPLVWRPLPNFSTPAPCACFFCPVPLKSVYLSFGKCISL